MSMTNKTATVMVPVEIPIVETKCNKCGKIICRRTDPHEHRDLYEDGIPSHQHSCITHPHQLNDEPEIHLCEECFQMFEEWLAVHIPSGQTPVPEAPVPEPPAPFVPEESVTQEQADPCEGCIDYSNWKGHKRWKGKDCTCSTCRYSRPNTVTPVPEAPTPPDIWNPCEDCKDESKWVIHPRFGGKVAKKKCSTCLHRVNAETTGS